MFLETQNKYQITSLPDDTVVKLESGEWKCAYGYRAAEGGPEFHRVQEQMEDGRFVVTDPPEEPACVQTFWDSLPPNATLGEALLRWMSPEEPMITKRLIASCPICNSRHAHFVQTVTTGKGTATCYGCGAVEMPLEAKKAYDDSVAAIS
jgi:hypothetical protein